MFDALKEILRSRTIRSTSGRSTGFLPLGAIHSVIVFVNVEDPSFEECKQTLMAFFRENGLKGEIYYFDLRRIEKEERLLTSIASTILTKDLNWYGKPSHDKISHLMQANPDLLISLLKEKNYAHDYMVRRSNARFKVGRQQIAGKAFALVLNEHEDSRLSEIQAFRNIMEFLHKIV